MAQDEVKYDPSDGALLHLHVGYVGLPDAREAGRIIERLANAFTQDMKRSRGLSRASLHLDMLEISSLVVFLRDVIDTAGALLTLMEHRELLGGFVSNIGDAVALIKGGTTKVAPALRTAIDAIVTPIAHERASHARINVVGDNNNVVIIERADAELIYRMLTPLRHSPGGSGGSSMPFPGPPTMAERERATLSRGVKVPADSGLVAALPASDETVWHGAAYLVKDRWYVALDEMGEQLLPLEQGGPRDCVLLDRAEYDFIGYLMPSSAAPRVFVLMGIRR